ncbi:MAG: carbonic anhydrase [Micrococcales bacterium]|nr:carbonic anhydrase [Micrococcales bacterium]MCL2666655.1 carbonic anhydrase [Micrococcales bacterium]
MTPLDAWTILREGNDRFVRGQPGHPCQDAARRRELQIAQHPHTVVLGCSDSRVAAEIIFDQGLGDVFVVRTAGHVLDTAVIGSIECGTEVLGAALVMVLGHDSCGAVAATAQTLATGEPPPGFPRTVVDKVIPSITQITSRANADGVGLPRELDAATLGTEHVRHTVAALSEFSEALRQGVDDGRLAIVGVEYDLVEGRARLVEVEGDVGERPTAS